MMCFAIIYIKSTDDILQNISKLDYLLKVSFFQRERTDAEEEEIELFGELAPPNN